MLCVSHWDSSTWLWHLLWVLGNLCLFLHLTLIPLASAEKLSFPVEEALLLKGMVRFDSFKMKTFSGVWNWDLPPSGPSVFSACSLIRVKELQKGWGVAFCACAGSLACMHLYNRCVPLIILIIGVWCVHLVCVSKFLAASFLFRLFLCEEPVNLRSAASALCLAAQLCREGTLLVSHHWDQF